MKLETTKNKQQQMTDKKHKKRKTYNDKNKEKTQTTKKNPGHIKRHRKQILTKKNND